jgi:histone acetyltransferase (RNA polymerase elongator complex component)
MPELACPHQCSFCDQRQISGQDKLPDPEMILKQIECHLNSFTATDREVEIAFFGGTFTGLPLQIQEKYLKIVHPFIESAQVNGIRISTRPDYIDEVNLKLLKENGVTTIELGAQSLDDEVLIASKRGHSAKDVEVASKLILRYGFRLGLQMMIGLPGDTPEKSIMTAQKIIGLGANETRIYPCLVIRNTLLSSQFQSNEYLPISLNDAVELSAELFLMFEKASVKVIRIGLHRNEDFDRGNFLAGPYHPNFLELVMTEIWRRNLENLLQNSVNESMNFFVHPSQLNFAVGYEGKNKKLLLQRFQKIAFKTDTTLSGRNFRIEIMPDS